jgi:hypothetical protein
MLNIVAFRNDSDVGSQAFGDDVEIPADYFSRSSVRQI